MTDFITEILSLHLEEEENRPCRTTVEMETAMIKHDTVTEIPEGAKLRKNGDIDKRYLKRSPEYREYISQYMKEMYRKNPDLAYKRGINMSRANIGKPWSEERRQARSDLQKNYIWITDGLNNTRVRKDTEMPEGWRRGRSDINPEWRRKIVETQRQKRLNKAEKQ